MSQKAWPRAIMVRAEGSASSGDLDILPEAEAPADPLHLRLGGLIGPRGALVTMAVDHDVVELDAVRAGAVGFGLRRLVEPFHVHGGTGEIVVAAGLDDIIAFGDNMAFKDCLHIRALQAYPNLPQSNAPCTGPIHK